MRQVKRLVLFFAANFGKLIYEISLYFYMKVPADFAPAGESFTEEDGTKRLRWGSPDEDIRMYPAFFRTALNEPTDIVKYFTTDER